MAGDLRVPVATDLAAWLVAADGSTATSLAQKPENPKRDESGTGRDESGFLGQNGHAGWDESAARACHLRSFQPSLQTKTATVCIPTATAHKPRPHRFLAIAMHLNEPVSRCRVTPSPTLSSALVQKPGGGQLSPIAQGPGRFARQNSGPRAGRVALASAHGGTASGRTFRNAHFDDIMMVWETVSSRDLSSRGPRGVRPGPGPHADLPRPEHSFCVSMPGSTTCFGRMP